MGCGASMIEVADVYEVAKKGPETSIGIAKVRYLDGCYGRASKIMMMLKHANVKFEFDGIAMFEMATSALKKYGAVPVCMRADGSLMKETEPIGRYIARMCDLYPTSPIECYRNDWLCESIYKPCFDKLNVHNLSLGQQSRDLFKYCTEIGLPKFMEAVTPYVKEGWAIGDGSKMYMADFYIGSIWTDVVYGHDLATGRKSWLGTQAPELMKEWHAKYPEFVAYGKRFEAAIAGYLDTRDV
jgi:hypothetical protein